MPSDEEYAALVSQLRLKQRASPRNEKAAARLRGFVSGVTGGEVEGSVFDPERAEEVAANRASSAGAVLADLLTSVPGGAAKAMLIPAWTLFKGNNQKAWATHNLAKSLRKGGSDWQDVWDKTKLSPNPGFHERSPESNRFISEVGAGDWDLPVKAGQHKLKDVYKNAELYDLDKSLKNIDVHVKKSGDAWDEAPAMYRGDVGKQGTIEFYLDKMGDYGSQDLRFLGDHEVSHPLFKTIAGTQGHHVFDEARSIPNFSARAFELAAELRDVAPQYSKIANTLESLSRMKGGPTSRVAWGADAGEVTANVSALRDAEMRRLRSGGRSMPSSSMAWNVNEHSLDRTVPPDLHGYNPSDITNAAVSALWKEGSPQETLQRFLRALPNNSDAAGLRSGLD